MACIARCGALELMVTDRSRGAAEFGLIDRIRARVPQRDDVILGIGDDAAVLQVPPGKQLVIATDTLNSGVHFPVDTAAADIGWKALAVNLSDLAAMGAQPAWCTLSLSLPCEDVAWLDAFLDGFLGLAALHDVVLVGGDTTRGPLSICVTVHGFVEPGSVLRRDGAELGDDIWISGTLGDAAGALSLLLPQRAADDIQSGDEHLSRHLSELRMRLNRPTPRVALGRALVGIAHAGIDISDGLLADLGHVCRASGVAAEVDLSTLPLSPVLLDTFDEERRRALQTSGGDDYELCFTAPVAARALLTSIAEVTGTPLTQIGRIAPGEGVSALGADGRPWVPQRMGYTHFAE